MILDALLADDVREAYEAQGKTWTRRYRLSQLSAVQELTNAYLYGSLHMPQIDEWATALLRRNFRPGETFEYNYAMAALALVLEPAAAEGDAFAQRFLKSLAGMGVAETRGAQQVAKVCITANERVKDEQESKVTIEGQAPAGQAQQEGSDASAVRSVRSGGPDQEQQAGDAEEP